MRASRRSSRRCQPARAPSTRPRAPAVRPEQLGLLAQQVDRLARLGERLLDARLAAVAAQGHVGADEAGDGAERGRADGGQVEHRRRALPARVLELREPLASLVELDLEDRLVDGQLGDLLPEVPDDASSRLPGSPLRRRGRRSGTRSRPSRSACRARPVDGVVVELAAAARHVRVVDPDAVVAHAAGAVVAGPGRRSVQLTEEARRAAYAAERVGRRRVVTTVMYGRPPLMSASRSSARGWRPGSSAAGSRRPRSR